MQASQNMQAGRLARVAKITRDDSDASRQGQDGLLVRRLNVAWKSEMGALWTVRFKDGSQSAFSEAELVQLDSSGNTGNHVTDSLGETWGVAPRTASAPKPGFGQGRRSARPALASILFAVAGLMLLVSGLASSALPTLALGALLSAMGIGLLVRTIFSKTNAAKPTGKG